MHFRRYIKIIVGKTQICLYNDKGLVNMKEKKLTESDLLKLEIAEELGLSEKIGQSGWKSLTARESGRIGGIMSGKKRKGNEK